MADPATRATPRAPSAAQLRDLFLLDPSVTFLNHGSFGACPRPVFEVYQRFQRELERQPIDFLSRRYEQRLHEVRTALAEFVNADLDGLVLLANTTAAVNTVARSLDLRVGDQVLTTDHEYGACVLAWEAAARAHGAEVVVAPLPDPLIGPDGVLAALDAARTDRTRVVFVSHLASVTSVLLPVVEICAWARSHGLLSVVDGAHVPGQLPLDVARVGADAYVGNCHKWLCAPKAAAFLWVAAPLRDLVEPLVVSWGCEPGAPFARRHSWGGTHDPAAALAVPAAIAFQDRHGWAEVRERGTALATRFQERMVDRYGVRPLHPGGPAWHRQMVAVPLPVPPDRAAQLQRALLEDWRIEVHLRPWRARTLIRPSFQGYTDAADLDRLLEALEALV